MYSANVKELAVFRRSFLSCNRIFRLLIGLSFGFATTDAVQSQPPRKSANSVRPAQTQQKPTANKSVSKELKIDPEKLPTNYLAPQERSPLLEIDQPLLVPEELEKLRKEDGKFGSTLVKAGSDEASLMVIHNGIRFRLAKMCLKENFENVKKLSDLRIDLERVLNGAGLAARDLKADRLREFRQVVMTDFLTQATPVLQNNLNVRVQIVVLMSELEAVSEDLRNKKMREAFVPAFEPLLTVILDPQQPPVVKIPAVYGLARILRTGTPNVGQRTKIAEAMIAELASNETHWWYQMRLSSGLGLIALDVSKQPIVVKALKNVVSDPDRSWTVRTEAAKSLGQVPIPPVSDPSSVVRAISEMALQMAQAAQPNSDNKIWKARFFKLYLAFQAESPNEKDATKNGTPGLLNQATASAAAKTAYANIVPLVSAILKGEPLTAEKISPLQEWLTSTVATTGK